jgi:predicted 3-demethylubiquinone-9 3-methyltransferase (glyoxalase superfamily)
MPAITATTQKITTLMMFGGNAEEAMRFYISLFEDAEVLAISRYGPSDAGASGTVRHATFSLAGQQFTCIDSPVKHEFGFTPAISLYVQCDSDDEIDCLYGRLAEQGQELMPLGSYDFSAKFGWVNDRFGVSWQLNLPGTSDIGA